MKSMNIAMNIGLLSHMSQQETSSTFNDCSVMSYHEEKRLVIIETFALKKLYGDKEHVEYSFIKTPMYQEAMHERSRQNEVYGNLSIMFSIRPQSLDLSVRFSADSTLKGPLKV